MKLTSTSEVAEYLDEIGKRNEYAKILGERWDGTSLLSLMLLLARDHSNDFIDYMRYVSALQRADALTITTVMLSHAMLIGYHQALDDLMNERIVL